MQDIELYRRMLGITAPWVVSEVRLELKQRAVTVIVTYDSSIPVACPVCGGQATIHDHQQRRWRHLDTMQLRTLIECAVPRANCEQHGVKQLPVAWAEGNARFTALFEALVIGWLQEASISAVAGMLENQFSELKSQCQMDYVPTRRLTGNQIYFLSAILAHNLYRELQMSVYAADRKTTAKRAALWIFEEAATLRHRLIQRAGRLTRPQGRLRLTLSGNEVTRKEYLRMLRGLKRAA